jgi:hypothetical protein
VRELTAAAVPLIALAGIVVAFGVLLTTRRLAAALPVLLDLLLAAGLIRLSATLTWRGIASAALIVVIRKLVVLGVGAGRRAVSAG